MGYFISDCFVFDCFSEGLCGQLTWSEMIKIGVFNEDKESDDESLGTYSNCLSCMSYSITGVGNLF